MIVPVIIASGMGENPPATCPASVVIAWLDGGALRLPESTYETALREAERWQSCMIREGKEGVIMVSC